MIKYPLGIQTFQEIIENNYPYVDKTKVISQLFYSKIFFLARPRRFGKSLLISTLKSIFEGRKDLFTGLYIENKIEWESYPVIVISLNIVANRDTDLKEVIFEKLNEYALMYNLKLENRSTGGRFMELVRKIAVNGKVVLLIDEYDKPLISFIDDLATFEKNRSILKEFYGSIKDLDAYLKFVFITEEIEDGLFRLRFPNEEVSESFTRYLLGEYTNQSTGNARYTAIKVRNAMKDKDKDALVAAINPIFANITYQIFLKDKEAYYHAVIHLIFMLLNYNIKSEVARSAGRIDTVLLEQNEVWLFEFKLNSTAEVAFQQIVEKDYAKPYQNMGKTIFGVGINFNSETKKINEIKFQML